MNEPHGIGICDIRLFYLIHGFGSNGQILVILNPGMILFFKSA
jgi:hypothetical protein